MCAGVWQYCMSKLDGDWLLKRVVLHDVTEEYMLLHVCNMVCTGIAHLHVLCIGALGDHRSAVLQSPSQECLCRAFAMLRCNCSNLLVLQDLRLSIRT